MLYFWSGTVVAAVFGRLLLQLVLFILLFILELLLLAKVGACCRVSGVVGAFLSGVGVF